MATATTARSRPSAGGIDPFRGLFRLLTSVRFALLQLAVVAVAALLGVVIPQAPDPVRLNPAAYDAWTEFQRGKFGPLAELMRRLDLFEVFHSLWFNGLLFFLMISVAVCTANRFAPIWRSVRRPIRRVTDRYFETAHARAAFATPADPSAVEAVLRAKRYKVERITDRDGARYLFADRFAWAQLATFATHLSLLLFLAGGIVSKLVGFSALSAVAEGGTFPVLPVGHKDHMQVLNLDSVEGRDDQGRVIDYRTMLVVYKDGGERCRGWTTVNNPLRCNGYTFHQATYTNNGAAIQVRDTRTGVVVYDEAPVLNDSPGIPSPRLVVRDATGAVVMDAFLTLAPLTQETLAQIFPMPDSGKLFAVSGTLAGSSKDWELAIFHARRADDPRDEDVRLTLRPGEQGQGAGYTFTFVELGANPMEVVQGIPGMERAALLQLARDVDGSTYLDVQNMAGRDAENSRFQLAPGESFTAGDYEYTFQGRREYTGVLVKRDPGSWFIWTATALLIGGLMVTFYVPRRRLWVKVTPETTYLAGIAERTAHLGEELERLGQDMCAAGNRAAASRERSRATPSRDT